jgi:hypothetical protein
MALKKEINWDLVELYVKSHNSQNKIAEALGIHPNTLSDRVKEKYNLDYSTFSTKLRSEGSILINAKQFEKAMKGYWPAMLWLGKIINGQKEPENTTYLAPAQTQLDQSQLIMQLEHALAEEKAKNANKSQAK